MITLRKVTKDELADLSFSDEYAEYIDLNSAGDRIICNGDTLIAAMEDGYLLDSFLDSIGVDSEPI